MNQCSRACTHYHRHIDTCPVDDRRSSAWVSANLTNEERDQLCNAETRNHQIRDLAARVHIGRYGGLEVRHECRGCQPRSAEYGTLCEQCHMRLAGWLDGAVSHHRWRPAEASIAWAFDWLAADREPRQAAAGMDKIMQGKRVPPAALNLHVTVLRDDICIALGRWLRWLTEDFDLHGPEWWRHRVENRRYEARSARSWRPQTHREVVEAQKYLHGWLDRVEGHTGLATAVYEEVEGLMMRVASVAPWRAEPKRLPDLECPSCERAALVLYSGDENLTCTRCREIVKRATYDRWSYLLTAERTG